MRPWLLLCAVNGFTSVAAGAFGAHALKSKLTPEMLAVFETGARYQMYHALALVAVAWLAESRPAPVVTYAGAAFTAGIVLFSGSLYALALTQVTRLGMITPLGGLSFLAGWALLGWSALRPG